ncbi:putative aldehyde dehydrogenase [Moraxella catarrhalis]|uniref:Putative aldehyde dehydrogenase n=1 Tax=Moraxella catarrhalis TaxID=480 RepID=A0A3S9QI11_MORCA|nr:putative aldehyde dehydrogenase [Moraxella catarrhalis]
MPIQIPKTVKFHSKKNTKFIGGKWVAPVDGEYFEDISPVDGKVFAKSLSPTKRC